MPPATAHGQTVLRRVRVCVCVCIYYYTFRSSLHCFDADVGPAGARLLHCGVVRCEGVEAGVVLDGAVVALQSAPCAENVFIWQSVKSFRKIKVRNKQWLGFYFIILNAYK